MKMAARRQQNGSSGNMALRIMPLMRGIASWRGSTARGTLAALRRARCAAARAGIAGHARAQRINLAPAQQRHIISKWHQAGGAQHQRNQPHQRRNDRP